MRLNSSVSTTPPGSMTMTSMAGGGPRDSTALPRRWSNRVMPGNITPSVGSTDRAMRAMSSGGKGRPAAWPNAPMAAVMSALLLPMPLPAGMGLAMDTWADRSLMPSWGVSSSRAMETACWVLGRWSRPRTRRPEGSPECRVTVARENWLMGQVTRKSAPSAMPCTSSPQVPGARAVAVPMSLSTGFTLTQTAPIQGGGFDWNGDAGHHQGYGVGVGGDGLVHRAEEVLELAAQG